MTYWTNATLPEVMNIISAAPADMAGAAGLVTPFVSLKNYDRAAFVLIKAAGTGGENPVITVEQAQNVAGTGAKALNVTRLYVKEHATAVEGIGTWTTVTQAAANTYTGTGGTQQIVAFEVKGDDLDVDGGFDCVRASVADTGTGASLGVLFVALRGARYSPGLSPLSN